MVVTGIGLLFNDDWWNTVGGTIRRPIFSASIQSIAAVDASHSGYPRGVTPRLIWGIHTQRKQILPGGNRTDVPGGDSRNGAAEQAWTGQSRQWSIVSPQQLRDGKRHSFKEKW